MYFQMDSSQEIVEATEKHKFYIIPNKLFTSYFDYLNDITLLNTKCVKEVDKLPDNHSYRLWFLQSCEMSTYHSEVNFFKP